MSVRDQLLKLQTAVEHAEASSVLDALMNFPTVTGLFEAREAQFGVRKVRGYKSEIFYKIKLKQSLDFPLWLQDYCPVKTEEHTDIQRAHLRVENTRWLTERHEFWDKQAYFESQTPESVREHFHALAELADRIETRAFLLEKSIEEFRNKSFQDFLIMMGMYFIGIVITIVIALGPFVHISKRDAGVSAQTQDPKVRSRVAPGRNRTRILAEEVARLRKIIPANSNIFLKAVPDKNVLQVGEKVTLTYSVFTQYRTKYWGLYNEGHFEGFQVEDRNTDKNFIQEVVREQGKKYMRVAAGTVTLLAVKAGGHFIYPGSAFVTAISDKGEIMDMYLLVKKIPITIQDAPQNKKP